MNGPIIRGTTIPLEQKFTEEFSPITGTVRSIQWKSFNPDNIAAYASYYAANGCSYRMDIEHGVAELVATDNSGQFVIDVWEVGINENVASSLQNPLNLQNIANANLLVIGRAIRDGSKLGDAANALVNDTLLASGTFPSDPTQFAFINPGAAAAQRLYSRIINQSDSYFLSQYTLRHTTNVSNRFNVNISDIGVNQIYTQAQLISEVTNASEWILPMPPRLVYKLNAIPVPGAVSNYLWGWLKTASPETTAPYDRVNIVTEYKLFQWSTDEYTPFS